MVLHTDVVTVIVDIAVIVSCGITLKSFGTTAIINHYNFIVIILVIHTQ